jgi:hypothetical protein
MEIPHKGRAKIQKNNDYESCVVSRLLGYFGEITLTLRLFNPALSVPSSALC